AVVAGEMLVVGMRFADERSVGADTESVFAPLHRISPTDVREIAIDTWQNRIGERIPISLSTCYEIALRYPGGRFSEGQMRSLRLGLICGLNRLQNDVRRLCALVIIRLRLIGGRDGAACELAGVVDERRQRMGHVIAGWIAHYGLVDLLLEISR